MQKETVWPTVSPASEQVESVIRRFETAWEAGQRPAIEDHLPTEPAQRRAVLVELVHADLRRRLKAGESARAESYLGRFPELAAEPQLALELIAAEYKHRQRLEPGLTPAEYLTRFPQYRQELAARLPGSPAASPIPAVATAATPFTDVLRAHGLLEGPRINEAAQLERSTPEPRALARELLGRGWLTAFQVNQLLQGRGAELALGPYVLLERLGKGGMGQVFKARHRLMNRIVALKVIRPEFLTHPEAASRFHREIQSAG